MSRFPPTLARFGPSRLSPDDIGPLWARQTSWTGLSQWLSECLPKESSGAVSWVVRWILLFVQLLKFGEEGRLTLEDGVKQTLDGVKFGPQL